VDKVINLSATFDSGPYMFCCLYLSFANSDKIRALYIRVMTKAHRQASASPRKNNNNNNNNNNNYNNNN
jgi:hypothetical protein